jgi:two-component system CheB/CheR fusion protein
VVAIGASAGGLAAFRKLLEHLPPETGMAYVLIPHLDPAHKSIMSEILSRTTQMPIQEAQDGLEVKPDHAYVISPNALMTISEEKLKIVPLDSGTARKHESIDHFMVSLARQYREKAIGVVLSGTASDGSLGIETIKSEGGITFAQDESAEFTNMPRNAIATGCVDFVLPPEKIAEELSKISKHPYVLRSPPPSIAEALSGPPNPDHERIFSLLRATTGMDFAQYKKTTIERRIARRMALQKVEDVRSYVRYLEDHPPEIRALHDELLINVTSFFREPEAFEVLKNAVFPALLKDRTASEPIRIWIPGCSTGEEAYSVLMTLDEFQRERGSHVPVQLFGTDASERAIDKARAGLYETGIKTEVSEDRLRRFFQAEGGGFRIAKSIRDLCVFAKQDVSRDPPFSRLDLLSCRNMLIYLGGSLQKRVIPLFHYAIKSGGFLLLGASESVDRYPKLFALVEQKCKVYRRLPGATPEHAPFLAERLSRVDAALRGESANIPAGADVAKATDRFLLAHYVPGVIVLNPQNQVVEVRGDIDLYVKIPPGKLSPNVLKLIREDLAVDLDQALREAKQTHLAVRRERIRISASGRLREISLEVLPLAGTDGPDQHYIIIFVTAPSLVSGPSTPEPSVPTRGDDDRGREVVKLKAELTAQRDYHQSVVERLEATNEELRSAGEETLSANEELQSTNEELETSKEEIQSTNEELATLNDELQHKNQELGDLNSDLLNVILGSNVALVIVDTTLRLKRFTPEAEKLLRLIPTDVGRRLTDFKIAFEISNLEKVIHGVIDTLVPVQQEMLDSQGHWYSMRVRPYRDIDNRIRGAVLVFQDIDDLRRSLTSLQEASALTEGILESIRIPLLILEPDLRVRRANRAFYANFQVSKEETERTYIYELGNRQWDIPKLKKLLEEILPKESQFEMEVTHEFEQIGRRTMHLFARRIMLEEAKFQKILLLIEDITNRKRDEEDLAQLNAGLERRIKERTSALEGARGEMEAFTYSVAHDLRAPLRAIGGFAQALLDDYVDRPFDAEGRDFAGRIIGSARQMDILIQDLLSYSQLTREKVSAEPVDLAEVLDAALLQMASEIATRKARIDIRRPLPVVLAHRSSLLQAISNLISNAIKFVGPGVEPRVRVWSEPRGNEVRLWVEDNGIGIEEKYHERIFRVFERLNKTEIYPGTGIGLAIVQRVVERVGGRAGVESALGKGSRFWIELRK